MCSSNCYVYFLLLIACSHAKVVQSNSSYTSTSTTTGVTPINLGECSDVSTNDKPPGCPIHFKLFLTILLDPAEKVTSYWNFISTIITPCINAETYSQVQSTLNINMTDDAVTLYMKDVTGRQYEQFYINYTTSYDYGKYIIQRMISRAETDMVVGMQNVIYFVTNIKCSSITNTAYPYLQSELNSFVHIHKLTAEDIPVRFFFTNEPQKNFGCGLDNLMLRTGGMADVIPGALNTQFTERQYGMCPNPPYTTTTTTTPKPSSGSLEWFAYIGIVFVSLIVLIIAFFILRRFLCPAWRPWQRCTDRIARRYLLKSKTHASSETAVTSQPVSTKTLGNEYTDHTAGKQGGCDKWELEPSKLHISKTKLGSGAYAVVYKGRLKGVPPVVNVFPRMQLNYILSDEENEVAVKTPPHNSTKEERAEFLREIDFMKHLEYYPYLLSMLACSTDPDFPVLVTELCELGDLSHLLREMNGTSSTKSIVLELKDLLAVSWQISDALAFLAHKNIIHRDVAARNVLLTESKMAKLSDFGLCRFNEEMFYTTRGGKLPIKWMAPESIEFAQFSTKSDVWSFGVLLFEEYSLGQTPYSHQQPEEMLAYLKSGKRLETPDRTPEDIASIMQQCFEPDPSVRPDFTEIRQRLYGLMERDSDTYGYLQVSGQYYHFTPSAEGAFTIVKPENINKNH